jgi:hypothetical protein
MTQLSAARARRAIAYPERRTVWRRSPRWQCVDEQLHLNIRLLAIRRGAQSSTCVFLNGRVYFVLTSADASHRPALRRTETAQPHNARAVAWTRVEFSWLIVKTCPAQRRRNRNQNCGFGNVNRFSPRGLRICALVRIAGAVFAGCAAPVGATAWRGLAYQQVEANALSPGKTGAATWDCHIAVD